MQLLGDTGCQGRVPEMPRHYPLDTRAEFRALYPAQAVLGDWWLGKGRAALVKRGPVRSLRLPQYRQRSHCHLRNKAGRVSARRQPSSSPQMTRSTFEAASYQWSGSGRDGWDAFVPVCQCIRVDASCRLVCSTRSLLVENCRTANLRRMHILACRPFDIFAVVAISSSAPYQSTTQGGTIL